MNTLAASRQVSRGLNQVAQFETSQHERLFLNNETLPELTSTMDDTNAAIDTKDVAIWVLSCMLLLFCCWLAKPTIPDETLTYRYRRRRRNSIDNDFDPVARAKLIDNSLIVLRVKNADETGNLELADIDGSVDGRSSISEDLISIDDENRIACCSICLESYRVGDIVAFQRHFESKETETATVCQHVFHQDCIVPFLQHPKHNECPLCRCVILADGDKVDNDDAASTSSLYTSSVFVIAHGLISRVRRASYNLIGASIPADILQSFDEESEGMFEMSAMNNLSQPSRFRRTLSFGDRFRQRPVKRKSGLAAGSTTLAIDDSHIVRSTTKLNYTPSQVAPAVALRRVVSAGPSSPIRRTKSSSRKEHFLHQSDMTADLHEDGMDEESLVQLALPSEFAMHRTFSSSSGIIRQRTISRQSIREVDDEDVDADEEDDLERHVATGSLFRAQHILSNNTGCTEEDEVLIIGKHESV